MSKPNYTDNMHEYRFGDLLFEYNETIRAYRNDEYQRWIRTLLMQLSRKEHLQHIEGIPLKDLISAAKLLPPGLRIPVKKK